MALPLIRTSDSCPVCTQQFLPCHEAHNAFGDSGKPNFLYPKRHIKINNRSLVVMFFFFTYLFERPTRLQVISSGRFTGYQRQTKGRNAANLVQHPSTRQRHGIIALRHLAQAPTHKTTVRIHNRTSQADESCIGHGNKQEPKPEHNHKLALWPSRSYRPKLALPYRAFHPLSLGIAFIRLPA